MNEVLQKAIECLDVQDIFLWSSNCSLMDGLDPKYIDSNSMVTQLRHNVARGEVMTLNVNEDNEMQIFRVLINFGARWVLEEDRDEEQGDESVDESIDVRGEIEASFISEYLMKSNPGQDALNEFALRNAIYHVWPYWREYLMSQCMRMNLPKAVLQAVQFAPSDNVEEESK